MVASEIKHYETKLKTLQEIITRDLSTVAHYNEITKEWEMNMEAGDNDTSDENINADRLEASDERSATVTLLNQEYKLITAALERIAHNTYGTCSVCQALIEPKRLDIEPAATTCIAHRETITEETL